MNIRRFAFLCMALCIILFPALSMGATLNISKYGTGTVTGSGIDCGSVCSKIYSYTDTVTLTASPGPGLFFSGWSGCDIPNGNECKMSAMIIDKDVTALFSPSAIYITASDNLDNNGNSIPDSPYDDMNRCVYNTSAQHPVEFNIYVSGPAPTTSAYLSLLIKDIDWPNEVDEVFLNGHSLGYPVGQNAQDFSTLFVIPDVSWVRSGNNTVKILIDLNHPNQTFWCANTQFGQLIIDAGNGSGPAIIRGAAKDKTSYNFGDDVTIDLEADTTLSTSQTVWLELLLRDPNGTIVKFDTKSTAKSWVINGSQDEPYKWTFSLPSTGTSGIWAVNITVYDTNTKLFQSRKAVSFMVGTGTTSPPTLASISPQSGLSDIETSVTIKGANFIPDYTSCTIGNLPITNLYVVDNNTITGKISSSLSMGTHSLTCETPNGSSTLTDSFTVCTFELSPTSQPFSNSGGTGTISVIPSNEKCSWTITNFDPWITVTSDASGTGTGTVSYSIAESTEPARTGTMTIGSKQFTVNQSSGCIFTITPASYSFASTGGEGTISVTASQSSCVRTAVSNDNWIAITSGSSGSGDGTVIYSVTANAGVLRTGTITVAEKTFTVNQGEFALNISKTGSGSGTIVSSPEAIGCPNNCTEKYAYKTTVVLSATPAEGSIFAGWSGDCTEKTGNSCSTTMTEAKNIGAIFIVNKYTIAQTGQATCYDALGGVISCENTGQDGDIKAGVAWPSPRFTVTYCNTSGPCSSQTSDCDGNATNDVVKDNLTGLIWARSVNLIGQSTWTGSFDSIASLNSSGLCGYIDWRLPNVNEQESIINAESGNNANWLIDQGFENIRSDYNYFTSTTFAADSLKAWHINLGSLYQIGYSSKTDSNYAWPVRGTASGPAWLRKTGQTMSYYSSKDDGALQKGITWPENRLSNNEDGTVTDKLTGLIWSREANAPGTECTPETAKTWEEANNYVKCLNTNNFLGHTNWRLPNSRELLSLVDYSKTSPALPSGNPFTKVQINNAYWSATTNPADTSYAWGIDMSNGTVNILNSNVSALNKTSTYQVWPVRGGLLDPNILISPTSYNFGLVKPGDTPPVKEFTISNKGNGDLIISSIALTGTDKGMFNVEEGGTEPCTSLHPTIEPGGSCTILTTFSPSTAGVKSASLAINSNHPNNPTINIPLSGTAGELAVDLALTEGWNFISVPVVPNDAAISSVLNDISPNIHVVWGYNNQIGQWLKYRPVGSPQYTVGSNTLTTIESGKGYWIYMDNAAILTIVGWDPTSTIHLYEGWNLIGYNGSDNADVVTKITTISDKWNIIWNWDKGAWKSRLSDAPSLLKSSILSPPVVTKFSRGKAYWIRIKTGSGEIDWTQ